MICSGIHEAIRRADREQQWYGIWQARVKIEQLSGQLLYPCGQLLHPYREIQRSPIHSVKIPGQVSVPAHAKDAAKKGGVRVQMLVSTLSMRSTRLENVLELSRSLRACTARGPAVCSTCREPPHNGSRARSARRDAGVKPLTVPEALPRGVSEEEMPRGGFRRTLSLKNCSPRAIRVSASIPVIAVRWFREQEERP